MPASMLRSLGLLGFISEISQGQIQNRFGTRVKDPGSFGRARKAPGWSRDVFNREHEHLEEWITFHVNCAKGPGLKMLAMREVQEDWIKHKSG
ncbi:unnamed protein product [Bathycoccus prasinos]